MSQTKIANDNLFNITITKQAIRELITLLNEETAALKSNDSSVVTKHYERKVDLIQYIENQNETLKKYDQVRASLSKTETNELKKLAQELQTVISVNKVELEKAQHFNKELINLVVEAVTGQGVDVVSYDKAGKRKKVSSKKVNPPAVSLNENV